MTTIGNGSGDTYGAFTAGHGHVLGKSSTGEGGSENGVRPHLDCGWGIDLEEEDIEVGY